MNDYNSFLKSKQIKFQASGIEIDRNLLHDLLFDFQKDLVYWALRKGRAAIFADTGLGKTFMQLEWARMIGDKVLIIAPLSVAKQTVNEARKIDLQVHYIRDGSLIKSNPGNIFITNYEPI